MNTAARPLDSICHSFGRTVGTPTIGARHGSMSMEEGEDALKNVDDRKEKKFEDNRSEVAVIRSGSVDNRRSRRRFHIATI